MTDWFWPSHCGGGKYGVIDRLIVWLIDWLGSSHCGGGEQDVIGWLIDD